MNEDFRKMANDAGIPTTEQGVKEKWMDVVAAEGSTISNNSETSPFWRIVTALVTTPVMWLVDYMVDTIMPNLFLKTASGIWLDLLAWGLNVERKGETKAQGIITFVRAESIGVLLVPAGTIIKSPTLNGVVYKLLVVSDSSFIDGQLSLDVPVIAEATGSAYNLASGYYSILSVSINGIVSVTNGNNWLSQPGADTESDEDLRARTRNQFNTVNDYHTDSVYRSIISRFNGVDSDAIFFDGNAPRGPGTASAYILLNTGVPNAQFLTDINYHINDEGYHGHGDDLQVFAMPETLHTLTTHVWTVPNLDAATLAQLQADIDAYIRAAFRENVDYTPTITRPYSRFSFSKLGQEIHRDFQNVESLDFSLADIVSGLEIPRLQAHTVTINA